jgi:hypothetical protein
MTALTCVVIAIELLTHPGGLDAKGGHHDRRTGSYHLHRSTAAVEPVIIPPPIDALSHSRSDAYRRGARTTARTQARLEGRKGIQPEDNESREAPKNDELEKLSREFRTWTDTSGKFSVIARFGGFSFGRVRLIKEDLSEIKVDVDVLSASDKTYVRAILSKHGINPGF